jgi:hypothetical protein
MEYQTVPENLFKGKVKHIVDNTTSLLENKISFMLKELTNLRTEYLDEIVKCIILIK